MARAEYSKGFRRADGIPPGEASPLTPGESQPAAGQGVDRLCTDGAVEVVVSLSDTDVALIPDLWMPDADDGGTSVEATVTAESGDGAYARSENVDRAEADSGPTGPPLLVGQFVEARIGGAAPKRYCAVPRAARRTVDEVRALRQATLIAIVPVGDLQRADGLVYVTGPLPEGQVAVPGGIQFATGSMVVRTSADGPG